MCAKPHFLLVALLVVPHVAHAETPAEAIVGAATRAIQNQEQADVFPGLLSADFKGYVGGWGPTTCEWYSRETFIDHVLGWQSTWSTNITLFNIREKIVTPASDGTVDVVLNLQIAYYAKPEFGGPVVNAYDVLQAWKVNAQGTQVVSFVELSALVLASNSSAMLAAPEQALNAVNTKNLTAIADAYSADTTVNFFGWQSFNRTDWLDHLSASFAARQNEVAYFSEMLYAVCDKYVWFLWTAIEQYNLAVPADNNIRTMLGYNVLDADGRIQTQNVWSFGGLVSHP